MREGSRHGKWIAAMLVGASLAACTPADLPRSTSRQSAPPADARLQWADGALSLDGRVVDEPVVADLLRERAAELQASAATSGEPFRGRLSIALPGTTESGSLLDILDDAAAAGFSKPWLLVRDELGQTWGIGLTLPTAQTRIALSSETAAPDAAARVQAGFANPVVRLDPQRGIVVSARDEVVDPGGHGVVLTCTSTPCSAWRIAELNRLVRRLKLDHPRDRAVMIVPGESVPVQTLVDVLDAARDDGITARGTRTLLPQALLAREGGT